MLPSKSTRLDLRQLRSQTGTTNSPYIRRRQFFAIRLGPYIFQLRLHTLFRGDSGVYAHTHPFAFWSWLIRGTYLEVVYRSPYVAITKWRNWLSLAYRSKDTVHRIAFVRNNYAVSLVLAIFDTRDPNYGKWGFLVNGKYVDHDEHLGGKA
jgi:hypothetical protein